MLTNRTRFSFARIGAAFALMVAATGAAAQTWPTARPITFTVPYAAGSVNDVMMRLVANAVGVRMKTTVIVENVNGAGGVLATEKVARAKPDGYNFIMGVDSTILLAQLVKPAVVKYDGLRDFTPVAMMATSPLVIVARPDLPVSDMQGFLKAVSANPKAYSYGTSGIGTSLHIAGEMLNKESGAELTHVPYAVSTQIMTDVAGSQLDLAIVPIGSAATFVRSGKVKALAVTSVERSPSLPNVPAARETHGLEKFNAGVWFGVFAPKDIEPTIVAHMAAEIGAALQTEDIQKRFFDMGVQSNFMPPERFQPFLLAQRARLKTVVEEKKIRVDQ